MTRQTLEGYSRAISASAKIVRLRAVNAELLEACKAAYASYNPMSGWAFGYSIGDRLKDAIRHAEE